MPRVNVVKKARKPIPSIGVAVGDTYYWWKFRHGGTHKSKTYPKPWQLTQSPFLQEYLQLVDELGSIDVEDYIDGTENLQSLIDDFKDRIEQLKEQCQESLDNMPENLQQGDTGQMLQERVEGLDEWVSQLDGIQVPGRPAELDEDGLDEERREELLDEWRGELQEVVDEVSDSDPGLS